MSDEIDAVSQRALAFHLGTLQVPASRAGATARMQRAAAGSARVVSVLPAIYVFVFAALALFFVWRLGAPWNSLVWVAFWAAVLAALVWMTLFGRISPSRTVQPQVALPLHRGIQALRQAAANGDNRLAPVVARNVDESREESADSPVTGRLQRMYGPPTAVAFAITVAVVLVLILSFVAPDRTLIHGLDWTFRTILIAGGALLLIEGLYFGFLGFQSVRPFRISADEQGIRWQEPTPWFVRRNVRASWQDVRALVTFHMSTVGKTGANIDEIYLLDTTKYAVAWKVTPKASTSLRETHEQFVRMVNEHAQLRDITTALKNLLESPETRSYEYAVAVLSSPESVPPSVRAALLPRLREPHFQQVYPVVAAILLTLLIVMGLLLQTGVIPAAGR